MTQGVSNPAWRRKKICIRRNSELEDPDPGIPFSATFVDLFQGGCETIESADCARAEHCGVRAMTWFGATLAAAAPPDTNDPQALILYTAEVDPVNDVVIFHNDTLSSHPLQTANILNDPSTVIELFPGETIAFEYPGLIENCVPPDQLHVVGPDPNEVPVGQTDPPATIAATVEFETDTAWRVGGIPAAVPTVPPRRYRRRLQRGGHRPAQPACELGVNVRSARQSTTRCVHIE